MRRYLVSIFLVLLIIALSGSYFFRKYWESRFDPIIAQQSRIYRLDERLVWSLIYEETYFRPGALGENEEVGLMQVTPLVAREWAKETGFRELERQAADNAVAFLSDPERNIQIGCWYLEKLRERYRGRPAETAMMLAAYNAGASRVEVWKKDPPENLSESEFISRIGIASTSAYVRSILERYRAIQSTNSDPNNNR